MKSSTLAVPPELSLTECQQQVLDCLENGQYHEAKQLIESQLAKAKSADTELLYLLAYVNSQTDNYNDAARQLQTILSQETSGASRYRAFQVKCLGDCYYHMRRTDDAIRQYKNALVMSKGLDELDVLRAEILEPLAACLMEKGGAKEAEDYFEQLVALRQKLAADKQLVNVGPLFWSELELLQIYQQRGEQDKFDAFHKSFAGLFDQLLSLRGKLFKPLTQSQKVDFSKRLKDVLITQYVKQYHPQTLAEYLWLISGYRLRTLPLISWEPSGDKQPKAVILCVHGLGLENLAFDAFASEMTARNFLIYAMDVRGFGAWQFELGKETVNFADSLSDIKVVIKILREHHPELPLFLLGESMGGALALRAASEFGGDMTGVIASVPSAERYGEARMSVRVAAHFVRHPNKPFDISKKVGAQATSDKQMQAIWKVDPLCKTALSPIELIKFNQFMITTQEKCSLIKSTPVLVVQGLSDRLVKPKGTYEMFDNINSTDKAMIIIGNAEHLIFETTHQSAMLLDGLTAWLNNHI